MNEAFFEYLSYSPRAAHDYLQFIVDIADIAVKNRSNPEIKPETVEKARRCRADALHRLAEMSQERPNGIAEEAHYQKGFKSNKPKEKSDIEPER